MAVYNGFPATYPQYYYPNYQPVPFQQQGVPNMQNMQNGNGQQGGQGNQQYPHIQSGFVRVQNENEARMYPVAPGNSVTFIDENAPFCYTKTVDMSQLDRPKFEKYKLVKVDDDAKPGDAANKAPETPAVDLSKYALKSDVTAFQDELNAIRADIETFRGDLYGLAGKKPASNKKKEVVTDE